MSANDTWKEGLGSVPFRSEPSFQICIKNNQTILQSIQAVSRKNKHGGARSNKASLKRHDDVVFLRAIVC